MKKRFSVMILAVTLVMIFSACSGQSTNTAAPSAGNAGSKPTASASVSPSPSAAAKSADKSKVLIGKTYTAGTLQYTITHTRALTKSRMTPAAGSYFFIVGAEIKNTSSTDFKTIYSGPIATSQFGLTDSTGKKYSVIAGTGDTEGRYEATKDIEAGKTVYGELMYEIPEGTSKLYLTISDEKGNDSQKIELTPVKP